MNSKKLAAIGLILAALSASSAPMAQINLDTAYAATGARPFDEPINPNQYIVRPGEQLEVVFLGAKLPNLRLSVNIEGRLVHPELGLFDLAGRTLAQVRTDLLEPLQRLYRADEIVISVNSIYPVAIQVTGAVNRPGTYMGYTSQRVSEIIDSAGGVAPGGSTRQMSFKGGPVDIHVDLDRHEYEQDRSSNPCLYAGYQLQVPPRAGTDVQIAGAVVFPRSVELLPGENVGSLIRLAGGGLPGIDLATAYLINDTDRPLTLSTTLKAGDVVVVPSAGDLDVAPPVKLFGFVSRPGLYECTPVLTLGELLQFVGGTSSEANPHRTTVFRLLEKDGWGHRPAGRYPLSPANADQASRLILRPGDSVFVPRQVGYVSVAGLVGRVGLVPYAAGQTVEDYVRRAGGCLESEGQPDIVVSDRVSGLTSAATLRTVVRDGDLITVRRGDEN